MKFWNRRSALGAGLVLGATLATACTNLPPVEVAPAPADLAGLRILVPAEVVLTGERLHIALGGSPELARISRSELSAALEQAGYRAVNDAAEPHDVRISLTLNVIEASSSVTTGRWASFFGQLQISRAAERLDTVYAQSHPDDVGRYYPNVEEAATRVVRELVNQIATSERLVETTGAGAGTEAPVHAEEETPAAAGDAPQSELEDPGAPPEDATPSEPPASDEAAPAEAPAEGAAQSPAP